MVLKFGLFAMMFFGILKSIVEKSGVDSPGLLVNPRNCMKKDKTV